MKRRKLVVFLTLALAFILVMAGCSQPAGEVEGNGEAAGEVMELLMGTGGTGGTYYPLGWGHCQRDE